MTTKPVPVYWDTCVYIACIQREPTRYPVLRHILDEAEAGRVVLVASSLVIAEVTHLPHRQNRWRNRPTAYASFSRTRLSRSAT